jgi:hypothetical protein
MTVFSLCVCLCPDFLLNGPSQIRTHSMAMVNLNYFSNNSVSKCCHFLRDWSEHFNILVLKYHNSSHQLKLM